MRIEDLPPKMREQAERQLSAERAKKAVKKAKYGNTKETIDNIKFDSQKEAQRFEELRLLEQANEITDLKLQVNFTLVEGFTTTYGERVKPMVYKADFTYYDNAGNYIIEDVKGMRTEVYKLKKKLMNQKGYRITEI
jgi:thermostable 8-oxoguanine DNA glycosylase